MAEHPHTHAHAHDHILTLTHVNKAFVLGIFFNFLFVVLEAGWGFYIHSLSLLSDAGHNLADVAMLALSLLAFRLLKIRSSTNYTYGYRKTSILVALLNALVLVATVVIIIYEAILRLFRPEPTAGATIAVVAGIGILVNGFTALLFLRHKDQDINVKGAYLHLLGDALVSLAIVAGGIVIAFTGWYWVDSLLSITVALVILFSTWGLLRDSLRLSLDGVPPDIHLDKIREAALQIAGVSNIHHIHIWALSSTETALTAHLVLQKHIRPEQEHKIKNDFRHSLLHQHIQHATLETEREDAYSEDKICGNADNDPAAAH